MTRAELLDLVRGVVVRVLEVDPATVTDATKLVEDLRADSIALVEIADLVEAALPGTTIPDADLDELVTVGDAVDYLAERL